MMITAFCMALNVILVSGSSLSEKVSQTPAEMYNEPGKTAKIKCSHSIDTYNRILWYKQMKDGQLQLLGYMVGDSGVQEPGVDVKIEGNANKDQTCTLTIEGLSLNSSAVYFCAASLQSYNEAYFGAGTKLTVLESGLEVTKPTVKVLKPSQKECRNSKAERKKTLVCVASQFYPDHVSVNWEIDGANVEDGVATDNAALRNGSYYKITSRLRVFAEDWNKEGINFTCIVSFFNGKETITVAKTIQSVKEFIEGKNVTRDKYMRITHTAKFSYGVFIAKSSIYGAFVAFLVWKLQGSNGKQNN